MRRALVARTRVRPAQASNASTRAVLTVRAPLGIRAPRAPPRTSGTAGVHGEQQGAADPFDAVGDLDVVDVDRQVRRRHGHCGQDARFVAHPDPQVRQVLGAERAAGQLAPRAGRAERGSRGDVAPASSSASRSVLRRPSRAHEALDDASRFSNRMSGQMPGSPAAIRVMSRNPRPRVARGRRLVRQRVLASFISDPARDAVRGSRWRRVDRGRPRPPPRRWRPFAQDAVERAVGLGLTSVVGVRTHVFPWKVGAGAGDAAKLRSGHGVTAEEPGVVRPRPRWSLHAGHVSHDQRCSRSLSTWRARDDARRDATTTRSTSGSSSMSDDHSGSSRGHRLRVSYRSRSRPAGALRARATDAPINRGPRLGVATIGEVSRRPGAFRRYTWRSSFGTRGIDVHQDADAHRHGAGYVDLTRAEERDVAEADAARHRRREGRRRSRVVVKMTLTTSSWASSLRSIQRSQQFLRGALDRLGRVDLTGRGTAKSP